MTDPIFATLFKRLFPLTAHGPARIDVIADRKRKESGVLWHGNVGALSDAIAKNIKWMRRDYKTVLLRVETPDGATHAMKVF